MQREMKWNMQREMRQEMKLAPKRAQDVRRYCQEKIRDILPVIPAVFLMFIEWLDIKGYDIAMKIIVKIIIAIIVIFVIFVVFYGLVMPLLVLQVGYALRAREGFANLLDMSWIMRAFIQADYRSSCFITIDDIEPAVKGVEMRCGQKVVYMTYIFPLIIKGKVILHALPAFRIVVGFKPTKKQLEKVQLLALVIPVACGNYALAAYTRAIFVGCIYEQPTSEAINAYLYPGMHQTMVGFA